MKITSRNLLLYNKQNNEKLNRNLTIEKNSIDYNKTEQKNTRTAKEISFGGSAVLGVSKATTKFAHRLIDFVFDNETAYVAVYSLIFAGMLKPLCVLNMPGSEDKDKQIVATKNFLQAFIGFAMNITVGGTIVKKAIDIIKNNLELIKQAPDRKSFEILDENIPREARKIESLAIGSLKKEKGSFSSKYKTLKEQKNIKGFDLATVIEALGKHAVVDEIEPKTLKKNELFIPIAKGDIVDKKEALKNTTREHLKLYNEPGVVDFINELLEDGNTRLYSGTAQKITQLLDEGKKEEFSTGVEEFIETIKSNAQAGKKTIAADELVDSYALEVIKKLPKSKSYKINCTDAIANLGEELKANLQQAKDSLEAKKLLESFLEQSKKYFSDETLLDTFESFWKNSTGWFTSIAKAKISSLLLPTVMASLFAQRNLKKELALKAKKENAPTLILSSAFKKSAGAFDSIMNFNKPKKSNKIPFTSLQKPIEKTAYYVQSFAVTKPAQKFIKSLHKLKQPLNKTSARSADMESLIITSYWTINTAKSKKIAKDQKLGLILHSWLVTGVSSIASLALDTLLDPLVVKGEKNYKNTILDIAKQAQNRVDKDKFIEESCESLLSSKKVSEKLKKLLSSDDINLFAKNGNLQKEIDYLGSQYSKKMKKFKSLSIFTLVVRFLIPVLMVPISGKLKKKIKQIQNEKIEKAKVA